MSEPAKAMRRIYRIIVAIIVVFSVNAILFGCGNSSNYSSSSNTTTTSTQYKEETFNDIVFEIPSELSKASGSSTSALYTLSDDAEDPFAITIHFQVDRNNGATAKSWYETFSEFENCRLVTSNGLEMCLTEGVFSSNELGSIAINFRCSGSFYSINIEYGLDSAPNYKSYAQRFYETVKQVGSINNNAPTAGNSSNVIPNGAINWSEAGKYVGQTKTFYGTVVETNFASSSKGMPTFLDIGVAYPDVKRLSLVVWGEDRGNFSGSLESLYKGKTIAVTGEVYKYDGINRIEVSSPSQIKVLD